MVHKINNVQDFNNELGELTKKTFSCNYGLKKIDSSLVFPISVKYNLETHYISVEGNYETSTTIKQRKVYAPITIPSVQPPIQDWSRPYITELRLIQEKQQIAKIMATPPDRKPKKPKILTSEYETVINF